MNNETRRQKTTQCCCSVKSDDKMCLLMGLHDEIENENKNHAIYLLNARCQPTANVVDNFFFSFVHYLEAAHAIHPRTMNVYGKKYVRARSLAPADYVDEDNDDVDDILYFSRAVLRFIR